MLIEIDAHELRRALRATSYAIRDDLTRPQLNSIRLGFDLGDPSKFSAVATDGTWLLRWFFSDGKVTVNKRDEHTFTLIRASDVNTVLRMLGPEPTGKAKLWTKRGRARFAGQSLDMQKVDIAFPHYPELFAKPQGPGLACIGVNSVLFTKAAAAFKSALYEKPYCAMTISFQGGPLDAMTITSDDVHHLTAILMPCRVSAAVSPLREAAAQ